MNSPPPPDPPAPELPPFHEDGICRKCGFKTVYMHYDRSRAAMKRTCARCDAIYYEAPLDACAL